MFQHNHGEHGDDEVKGRTLYVGSLDPSVTEDFIAYLFGQFGKVETCKLIHEPGCDPYCFVEFSDPKSAAVALCSMNGRWCFDKQLKVNWASSGNAAPKQDTSKHHHVFVGDLCPDVEQHNLRAAFSMYGEISDVKIIKDSTTNKPKGYGFVTFVNREDAKLAIDEMQGALLGGRNIRTNWATRKPVPNNPREGSGYHQHAPKQLKYDEVYRMSSATNCTVYCGQSLPNLSEELVKNYFSEYGNILEIRIFKDKGYAFVRFSEKDDATRAIVGVNGQEINGVPCRCSWGKESNDSGNSQQQLQQPQGSASSSYNQYGYQQYQQPYNYYPGYVPQAGAYQQYYGNYQMPGYGGMPMGDQGGGAQGPHYNGQQMQNMGYQ